MLWYDDLDFIQLARRRVHWRGPSCWESRKRGDEIWVFQEENLWMLPTFSKILSTLKNFPIFHVLWDEQNHFFLSVDLITLYISTNINIWFALVFSLHFSFLSTVEPSRTSVYVHLPILGISSITEVWIRYSARLERRNSWWVYSRRWDVGIWWEISQQLGHREIETAAPVNSMLQFEKLV
jgi:hypothetical protein